MLTQLINRNAQNDIIFAGTALATLTNPYFLFYLKSRQTRQNLFFVGTNISSATSSYDKITIIETGTTANYTASTPYFSLSPGEYWDVEIYEQASATNLSIANATTRVDRGIIYSSGYTQTVEYFFTGSTENNTDIFLQL